MPKKLAVEKQNVKNQMRTHSPKSHPQNTPNKDKHTQNPKKEKRKKNTDKEQNTLSKLLIVFL
jgi:hypothetical protein